MINNAEFEQSNIFEKLEIRPEKEVIVFYKTSDPFISAGISGLIKYCEKRKDEYGDLDFEFNNNELKIEANNLNDILQKMYLEMGEKYYNIANKKSLSDKNSFYYDEKNNKIVQSKYRTYGFSYLLNNSKQRAIGKKVKIDALTVEAKKNLKDYFDENDLNPDKHTIINVNGRNTTIPQYENMNVTIGNRPCSVCGNSFAKTWESKSISPFLKGASGGSNYVSFMKGAEKVCWKCEYLLRFSPVYAFFQYAGKSINSFFFNSDSLSGMQIINKEIIEQMFLLPEQLIEFSFMKNFSFFKFGNEENKDYFNYSSEQLLMLLYTIYQQIELAKPRIIEKNDWVQFEEIIQYKTEVFYLKAKEFGSTLRPVKAEKFTDFYYLFSVFKILEKENINLQYLMWGLKISAGDNKSVLRDKWAELFLHRKPTINICEKIVWVNFMNKQFDKDFNQILKWIINYESIINYGGNNLMNDETRDIAIKLGSQLGYAAKNDNNPKAGKGKLIRMRKSRKITQFLDQIISFQMRYGISVNKEILQKINEENFEYFRQFTIISALNSFNFNKKENTNEN